MKLKDWNKEERPRERLARLGAKNLGNAELLAIFLGSGVPGTNAVDVAQALLAQAGGRLTEMSGWSLEKYMEQKGVGAARAGAIAAALELGRRFMDEQTEPRATVTGPEDVFRLMLPKLKGLRHEECWALYLNRSNIVIDRELLTTGTVDATLFDTKHILRSVIERKAKAVILVHNHPSGSPLPGEADLQATRQLQLALRAFDARLFDHVIIADGSWYSFQEERVCKSK